MGEPAIDWPHPRVAVPFSRCAVDKCASKRTTTRGLDRRWCEEHADAYDLECLRRREDAPVFDILTGERVR